MSTILRHRITLLFIGVGLLVSAAPLHGQTITLSDETGDPVSFAHVLLRGVDHAGSVALVTDHKGKTQFPDEWRDYTSSIVIEIKHIGYRPVIDTIPQPSDRAYALQTGEVMLNPAVVTAQHGAAKRDASVHKMKVIDRNRIDAQGAVNLRDVLRHETNLRISQDQILGSGLSMQGISGENVKILIDGVPVIGRLNGNIDLSQINLNNIERIEMVEGPLSVNYGTDALAGTINLITQKNTGTRSSAGFNTYYESAGQYNTDGRITLSAGNHGFQLSGGRQYFDGWSPDDPFIQFPKSQPADTNRTHEWNPKEQYFARLQYHFDGEQLSIRPYFDYFSEVITNRGFPRQPYLELAFDDRYKTERTDLGIDMTTDLGQKSRLKIIAAYNHFERTKNTYLKDLTTLNQQLTDNPGDQDTSKFELLMSRGNLTIPFDSAGISVEVGYDVQWESAFGARIDNDDQNLGDFAVFATAEWTPVKQLVVRPGLRATYNTRYRAPLVPSLNAKFDVGNFSIRGSYARGFRAPGLKELYFNFVDINHNISGNDNLMAEQSNNFQFSVDWKKAGAKNMFEWSVGGYFNDIHHLITLAQIPGSAQYTYTNIGRFQTIGYQISAGWIREKMKLDVSGALVGRYNSLSAETDAPHFSYSPEFRAIADLEIPGTKINCGIFYTYTGALPGFRIDAENNIAETKIADYHLLDLSFSRAFFNDKLRWTIGAKNLLNVQNIESGITSGGVHSNGSGAVPVSWGRSVFTSLQFNLSWK